MRMSLSPGLSPEPHPHSNMHGMGRGQPPRSPLHDRGNHPPCHLRFRTVLLDVLISSGDRCFTLCYFIIYKFEPSLLCRNTRPRQLPACVSSPPAAPLAPHTSAPRPAREKPRNLVSGLYTPLIFFPSQGKRRNQRRSFPSTPQYGPWDRNWGCTM